MEIKIFKNPQFGEIRTIEKDGEPWFVGKDVAELLGYAKPQNAIATHVDDEDKTLAPIQGICSKSKHIFYGVVFCDLIFIIAGVVVSTLSLI